MVRLANRHLKARRVLRLTSAPVYRKASREGTLLLYSRGYRLSPWPFCLLCPAAMATRAPRRLCVSFCAFSSLSFVLPVTHVIGTGRGGGGSVLVPNPVSSSPDLAFWAIIDTVVIDATFAPRKYPSSHLQDCPHPGEAEP